MARAVREQGLDAAVLGDVVGNAEQLGAASRFVAHRRHVDVDGAGAVRELDLEGDRATITGSAGEVAEVGDEGVGRQHRAQVVADLEVVRELEQLAARWIQVQEPERVVGIDRYRERGLRQEIEEREGSVAERLACGPRSPAASVLRFEGSDRLQRCHRRLPWLPSALSARTRAS